MAESAEGEVCEVMPADKQQQKIERQQRKKLRRKKRTALIICKDRKQFWTTQTQFWQWFRDGLLEKRGDHPLTGAFIRENEELMVLIQRTVLNLANRNHLREALHARRVGLAKR